MACGSGFPVHEGDFLDVIDQQCCKGGEKGDVAPLSCQCVLMPLHFFLELLKNNVYFLSIYSYNKGYGASFLHLLIYFAFKVKRLKLS